MKKLLCGTTALAGVSLFAGQAAINPAMAEDGIKLSVGGFFRAAYQVVVDDDEAGDVGAGIPNELGFDRNTDGFFNDAEIHFVGSTVLDNGLEVGARVELEGETEGSMGGDQIDEAWVWFSGGWGELRFGSDDDALANACVVPPGGTTNFSAFSPNQWGANSVNSNTVCTGVGSRGDAQKVIYITPAFYGFQLTASYTPEEDAETHDDGAGPHLGMPGKVDGHTDYGASVYLTYTYEGEDWGLTWGGGVSLESGSGDSDFGGFTANVNDQDFYQTALNLRFGNFSFGAAFEYLNDLTNLTLSNGGVSGNDEHDAWIVGGGVAYTMDAWTFGAQYSYREDEFDINNFIDLQVTQVQQRAVLTANYALGPGILVDGELAYTWIDEDPENGLLGQTGDDYDGFEIGFGTAITF
jgi:predicted porin